MEDKKRDSPGQETISNNCSTYLVDTTSIPQDTKKENNNNTKSSKNKKRKLKNLSYASSVRTLAAKFYSEQLIADEQYFYNSIRNFKDKHIQILAIKHDRDEKTDGIWKVAQEKHHYHLIIRHTQRKTFRVSSILKKLGVQFREGLDDLLLQNRGIETCSNFSAYANYLTHDTKQSQADGKAFYDIDEIISNLNRDEIDQVRDGYIRVTQNRKLTQEELIALDQEAYDCGYNLKSFDDFYDSLNFSTRTNSKMRTIRESYERGLEKRISKREEVCRLCLFIKGDNNLGKTYASINALPEGTEYHIITAQKSGKFDDVKATTKALIVDDTTIPYLLNVCDNYFCQLYRRNKGTPSWTGDFLIVTSNYSFLDWINCCGFRNQERIKAISSRFCLAHIEQNEQGTSSLIIDKISNRGNDKFVQERVNKLDTYVKKFNQIIGSYNPKKINTDIDYLDLPLSDNLKQTIAEKNN